MVAKYVNKEERPFYRQAKCWIRVMKHNLKIMHVVMCCLVRAIAHHRGLSVWSSGVMIFSSGNVKKLGEERISELVQVPQVSHEVAWY